MRRRAVVFGLLFLASVGAAAATADEPHRYAIPSVDEVRAWTAERDGSQPCPERIHRGLSCPIAITATAGEDPRCPATGLVQPECTEDPRMLAEIQWLASHVPWCERLGPNKGILEQQGCQVAAAADLILRGEVPDCSRATRPDDPVFDSPICLIWILPEPPQPTLDTPATVRHGLRLDARHGAAP